VDEDGLSLSGKDYVLWESKAEHITTLYFEDNNKSLEVELNVLGVEDTYSVSFSEETYLEVKSLFTEKLQGVNTRALSRYKQISVPGGIFGSIATLTGIIWWFAHQIETTGEYLDPGQRKYGGANKVINNLTDNFGSNGILIGGGACAGIFLLWILKVLVSPSKGATVDFNYGESKMKFKS